MIGLGSAALPAAVPSAGKATSFPKGTKKCLQFLNAVPVESAACCRDLFSSVTFVRINHKLWTTPFFRTSFNIRWYSVQIYALNLIFSIGKTSISSFLSCAYDVIMFLDHGERRCHSDTSLFACASKWRVPLPKAFNILVRDAHC